MTTYRHKKRGTECVLIGYGKMQASEWRERGWNDIWQAETLSTEVDMREVAIKTKSTLLHNVHDKHRQWTGSWEAMPLVYDQLTSADIGRRVIYVDSHGPSEVGILTSWRDGIVFARYSTGDTAAAAEPARLYIAVQPLDGPEQ